MPPNSYTSYLFSQGIVRICEKVKEESGEVIQAATWETKQRLVEETVDLLYHLFVLLVSKGVSLDEVLREMASRRQNRKQTVQKPKGLGRRVTRTKT